MLLLILQHRDTNMKVKSSKLKKTCCHCDTAKGGRSNPVRDRHGAKLLAMTLFNLALLIVTLHFTLYTLHLSEANAQTISLSIWPPLLEVQMMPGKTVIQNYQLSNNTESFLDVTPLLVPFEPDKNAGQIKFLPSDKNENSPYFFSFSSDEKLNEVFTLKPKETRQISLKITLPKNTPEKDYYFTLLFSTGVIPPEQKNNTASITQIGTNILLTSSREEKPALLGRIIKFRAPTIIDSFSAVNFELVLENFGKTFWKPFGEINITGMLKQKGTVELLPQNVLANSQRSLTISQYKPSLPIGPFKAKVSFSLNEEGSLPVLSTEIAFWYLPIKAAVSLLMLFIIFTTVKRIKKSRQTKK